MTYYQQYIALKTLIIHEIQRVFRIWLQTLLPPAITSILYFVIFGQVIGARVGDMEGRHYIEFIAPGLIMMNIITSSYSSTVSSFFGSKFQRSIEELLVAPISSFTILLGYLCGGVLRGVMVGTIVTIIALGFTHLHVYSFWIIFTTTLLASTIFSLGGVINAIYARNFDDISIIPTFVLTPLTYLGGVFYSINLLPPFWRKLSLVNPIVYIVGNFRSGFFDALNYPLLLVAYLVMGGITLGLFFFSYFLIKNGTGLRE